MPARLTECLDWDSPNKPGELWENADFFKSGGIELLAFWAYTGRGGRDKLAAVAKEPERLRAALERRGLQPRGSRCFLVWGADAGAALIRSLKVLAGENINVECADWISARGRFTAALWVRPENLERAAGLLKVRGGAGERKS
ncbi:MAG: hypothetical protein PHF00_13685 [Elusimicrobia bacterium]|nr:hypothetical protein [Elusimicrobiota bacterium]